MTNAQRIHAAMISVVVLIGMMFSDEASIILWIPVIGLGIAAATGTCYGQIVAEKLEPVVTKLLAKINTP